jgi:hypothetical protein
MNKKLASLSILGMALALAFVIGGHSARTAQGDTGKLVLVNWFSDLSRNQINVAKDLGEFHKNDTNQFGDDRAATNVNGSNKDADFRAYNFVPDTYGLMGDYSRDSGPGTGGP